MSPDSDVAAVSGEEFVPCYACAEPVRPAARKCRWCGEWYGFLAQSREPYEINAASVETEMTRRLADPHGLRDGPDPDDRTTAFLDAARVAPLELRFAATDGTPSGIDAAFEIAAAGIAQEFGIVVPELDIASGTVDPGFFELYVDGVMAARVAREDGASVDGRAVWLRSALQAHLEHFLTREAVADLLSAARRRTPMVVQELVPNMLALGQLRLVLHGLASEGVPINDMSTVLNALADNAVYTKDPRALSEHVRRALGGAICARLAGGGNLIRGFMLSPDAERAIHNSIQLNETGQVLMLDPTTSNAIAENLAEALRRHSDSITRGIVVTPPKIRRHVYDLLVRNFPDITVLAYSEIENGMQIDNLATIEAHRPGEQPIAIEREPVDLGDTTTGDWLW